MFEIVAKDKNHLILEKTYSSFLNRVEQRLQDVKQEIGFSDIVFPQGKRLRPRLCLLSFLICHQSTPDSSSAEMRLIDTATALEMLHEASLIHDDLLDNANTRRGRISFHKSHGKAIALVIGDIFFCKSVELIINTISQPSNAFLTLRFIVTAGNIAKGEIFQQYNRLKGTNVVLNIPNYLKYIRNKTAILFAASCELGALLAGQKRIRALDFWKFGEALGMAFQIRDDILDLVSNEVALGKDAGNDFFTGNQTLPYILGYQSLQEQNLISQGKQTIEFTQIQKVLEDCGAIKKAIAYYQKYYNRAIQRLSTFPMNEARSLLQNITDKIGEL